MQVTMQYSLQAKCINKKAKNVMSLSHSQIEMQQQQQFFHYFINSIGSSSTLALMALK